MKRDMDLVRKILIQINEFDHGFVSDPFVVEGYSDEEVGYNCFILAEAGLIIAEENTSYGSDVRSPTAQPIRLTWEGHEFVDKILDDDIWSNAKTAVSKVGDASLGIWSTVLTQIILKNLGLTS